MNTEDYKIISDFLFAIYEADGDDTHKSNFVRILKIANDLGYSNDDIVKYIRFMEDEHECFGRYIGDFFSTISNMLSIILSNIYKYYDKISDDDKIMIKKYYEFYYEAHFNRYYFDILSYTTEEEKAKIYDNYIQNIEKEVKYINKKLTDYISENYITQIKNYLTELNILLESTRGTKNNVELLNYDKKNNILNRYNNIIDAMRKLRDDTDNYLFKS